jgi:hypothetical protein
MRRITVLFVLFFTVYLLTGCSKKPYPDGMPKLYSAQVTVVSNGQPVADAMVTLMPIDPNSRWASGGQTNTNGIAILKTQGVYSGAATGKYKVCISKTETDPTVPVGPDETPPETNSYNLIDPKFGDIATAEEIEVSAGNNSWKIDVGKPVRELIEQR